MRARFLITLLLATALTALAQGQVIDSLRQEIGGQYYAQAFASWNASTTTPVIAPGLATVVVDASYLKTGVPLQVKDGADSEVITPTAVDCSAGQCTLTATFSYAHPGGFQLASANGGLNEAIEAASQTGGTVVVGPGWSGGGAQIVHAAGQANVAVLDIRAGQRSLYTWNRSQYALTPAITPAAFGASASAGATTATCTAGSNSVTLASAADFAGSQGIALSGCGAAAFGGTAITPPTPAVINWCGQNGEMACATAPGSTTYNYKIVVDDGSEGYTAAGAEATTATGAATLGSSCCNNVVGANYLTWSAPAGITTNTYGYFVYAQKGTGPWQLIGLQTIPGYAMPWQASHLYANGRYVTPAAAPNGSYYVAISGGTSGASEPSWCTSSATCTVTDGTVTWQRQPFSWMDIGATVNWPQLPGWIPTTPPVTGSADALVTTIASGAGTTALTLAAPAVATATLAWTTHDDSAAINAALAAQGSACVQQYVAGNAPSIGCPPIRFAPGQYNVSEPLSFGSALNVTGAEGAFINAQEPFQNVFTSGWVLQADLSGLHFNGGKTVLFILQSGSDANRFNVDNIDVRYTTGFALNLGQSNTGAEGLSIKISGMFVADREMLLFSGDWCQIEPNTWLEPAFSNVEAYQPQIYDLGQSLALHGLVGVPAGLPYDRWIDAFPGRGYGNFVTIDDSTRLGGENGGISPIYLLGGFGASQAFNWSLATTGLGQPYDWFGTSISIRDTSLAQGQAGVVTVLNNSFPQHVTLSGNNEGLRSPIVDTCTAIGTSVDTAQCALPPGFTPTNLDTVLEGSLGGLQTVSFDVHGSNNSGPWCAPWDTQTELLPYMTSSQCRVSFAPPSSGVWPVSGTDPTSAAILPMIANAKPASGAPSGWLLQSESTQWGGPERAAPAWQPTTTYTLATSPFGQGNDFVQATVSGTAYSFYVSAVSSGTTCMSGASAPSWNATFNASTGAGATTTDGSCTWKVETYGTEQWWTDGYIAPYFTVPVADFFPVGVIGSMSATVAGSTTSLGANSCGDSVTATVAGATMGMIATANIQGALPQTGLTLQAAVTAANTVTVEYCNVTTSAITPGPATIAVRVQP